MRKRAQDGLKRIESVFTEGGKPLPTVLTDDGGESQSKSPPFSQAAENDKPANLNNASSAASGASSASSGVGAMEGNER